MVTKFFLSKRMKIMI